MLSLINYLRVNFHILCTVISIDFNFFEDNQANNK